MWTWVLCLLVVLHDCVGTWEDLDASFQTLCLGNQSRDFFLIRNQTYDRSGVPQTFDILDLQEGCSAKGGAHNEYHIGLSVSVDYLGSTAVEGLKAALAYIYILSRNTPKHLKFCLCDDKRSFEDAIHLYDFFLTNQTYLSYAVLGPSEPEFATILAVRADSAGKIMILWSFDKRFYSFSPSGNEHIDTTVMDEVELLESQKIAGTLSSPHGIIVTPDTIFRRLQETDVANQDTSSEISHATNRAPGDETGLLPIAPLRELSSQSPIARYWYWGFEVQGILLAAPTAERQFETLVTDNIIQHSASAGFTLERSYIDLQLDYILPQTGSVASTSLLSGSLRVYVTIPDVPALSSPPSPFDNAFWWLTLTDLLIPSLNSSNLRMPNTQFAFTTTHPMSSIVTLICPANETRSTQLIFACGVVENVTAILSVIPGADVSFQLPSDITSFNISVTASSSNFDMQLKVGSTLVVAESGAFINQSSRQGEMDGLKVEFSGDGGLDQPEWIHAIALAPSDLLIRIFDTVANDPSRHDSVLEIAYSYTLASCPSSPHGCSLSTTTTTSILDFERKCWLRAQFCAPSFQYGSDNVMGCTLLGGMSTPWCSHDAIYSGAWSYCKHLCDYGSPQCPDGYEQISPVVFECNGTSSDTLAVTLSHDVNTPVTAFTIPPSVIDFTLNISSALADFDVLVYDPSTAQAVVQRLTGVANQFGTTASYYGMTITYEPHELDTGQPSYAETITFSGVMPHSMLLRLSGHGADFSQFTDPLQRQVDVSYSFSDFETCPSVPAGCVPLETTTMSQATLAATTETTTTASVNLNCGPNYFRNQPVLFGCEEAEISVISWVVHTHVTGVELPPNIKDVEFVMNSNVYVQFSVYDPATQTTVVSMDPSARINNDNMLGEYLGVVISYSGGTTSVPQTEGIVVTGTLPQKLVIEIRTNSLTPVEINMQVKHKGIAPCPARYYGCLWYDVADTTLLSARVSWAQRMRLRYIYGADHLWSHLSSDAIFSAYITPNGISWEDFWFLWAYGFGVGGWATTDMQVWKKAFSTADIDHNGWLSQSEFTVMFNFNQFVELDPDGAMWSIGLTRVFSINVPPSMYPSGAITNLYYAGARQIFAIAGAEVDMIGKCNFALEYALSLGYNISAPLQVVGFGNISEVLGSSAIPGVLDVFLVCTSSVDLLTRLIIDSIVFQISPKAWLLQAPFGHQLSSRLEAYIINYFIEPVPWSAATLSSPWVQFLNCHTFLEEFVQTSGQNVSLIFTQMSAALTALHKAITNATAVATDLEAQAEAMGYFLRTEVVNTCFGDLQFDTKGKRYIQPDARQSVRTRQYFPLVEVEQVRTSEYFALALERFFSCTIELASSSASAGRRLTIADKQLDYRGLSFSRKMQEVYACNAGCEYQNLVCRPCLPGNIRHKEDLACIACPTGKYSNQYGLEACKDCPTGASCASHNSTPTALEGYFRVDATTEDGPFHNSDSYYTPEDAATTGYKHIAPEMEADICLIGAAVERYQFYRCSPKSICQANNQCPPGNTGIYCAACENEHSFYGAFKALRKCSKCPESHTVFVQAIALLAGYLIVFGLVSHCFHIAALNQRSIVAPLVRESLFHLQMLGAIAENCALGEADSVYNYFPGCVADWLINPYMLIKFDCFWHASYRLGMYKAMLYASALIPIIGALLIILFHLLRFIFYELEYFAVNTAQKTQVFGDQDDKDVAGEGVQADDKAHPPATSSAKSSSSIAYRASAATGKQQACEMATRKNYHRAKLVRRVVLNMDHHQNVNALVRHICVWVFLTYASVVTIAVQTNGCTDELDKPRLRIDLDILCTAPKFQPLQQLGSRFSAGVAGIIPILILLLLLWMADDFNDIKIRETLGIFYIGYKETHWFWTVFQMTQVMTLLGCGAVRSAAARAQCTLAVLVGMTAIQYWQVPELDFDRHSLGTFVHLSRMSLILTNIFMIVVNINQWDVGFGLDTFTFLVKMNEQKSLIGDGLAILHSFVLLSGCFSMLYNAYAVSLKTLRDGTPDYHGMAKPIGFLGNKFLDLCKSCFGLNPLGLQSRRTEDGEIEDTVVLKRLNESEQAYLQFSLAEMLKDCMDSSQQLSTALIGSAVSKALHTSMRWRTSHLTDISDASMTRKNNLVFDDERAGKGVTVDEIFMATHAVGKDIMHRHPAMARLSLGDVAEEPEATLKENGVSDTFAGGAVETKDSDEEVEINGVAREADLQRDARNDVDSVNALVASSVHSIYRSEDQRLYRLRELDLLKEKISQSKLEVEHLRNELQRRQNYRRASPSGPQDSVSVAAQTNLGISTLSGWGSGMDSQKEKNNQELVVDVRGARPKALAEKRQLAVEEYVKTQAQKRTEKEMSLMSWMQKDALGEVFMASDALARSEDTRALANKPSSTEEDKGSEAQGSTFLSFGARVLSKFGMSPSVPSRSGNETKLDQAPTVTAGRAESTDRPTTFSDILRQNYSTDEVPRSSMTPARPRQDEQARSEELTSSPAAPLDERARYVEHGERVGIGAQSASQTLQQSVKQNDFRLDFHFPGKVEGAAVGIFKTMFFAALRELDATDEHLDDLQFKVIHGPSDSIFIARLEGFEASLLKLRDLNHEKLDVGGYVLQAVDEVVPAR